jgi:peptide deformylase
MAIRKILTQDDEFNTLRKPCIEVVSFDKELRDLVEDMWDTMYAARGVGLAATQIGSSLRVAVIDTLQRPSTHRHLVIINPSILEFRREQTAEEGCLSMPGLHWPITRAASVTVQFRGLSGRLRKMGAGGLLARAIQHECDHLNGILCNSLAK